MTFDWYWLISARTICSYNRDNVNWLRRRLWKYDVLDQSPELIHHEQERGYMVILTLDVQSTMQEREGGRKKSERTAHTQFKDLVEALRLAKKEFLDVKTRPFMCAP